MRRFPHASWILACGLVSCNSSVFPHSSSVADAGSDASDSTVSLDGGADTKGSDDSTVGSDSSDSSGSSDGSASSDVGPACQPAQVGRFCVLGSPGNAHDFLEVGAPIRVQVWPKGCFSSSCTQVVAGSCAIGPESPSGFPVAADICLHHASGDVACSADCGEVGSATCEASAKWEGGPHTVHVGSLAVTVSVPSAIDMGGACTGSQF